MQKPEITAIKSVAKSRLFHIEAVDLTFSNGEKRTFERIGRPHQDAVMIVPVTDDNEFILIREYGVGIEDYELTFPKGIIDNGESVFEAANRELQEEVAFGANDIVELRTVGASPSYMFSRLHIVLARDLFVKKLQGDEPEPLEIVKWPLSDYNALLLRDDFISSAAVAALLLAKERLHIY